MEELNLPSEFALPLWDDINKRYIKEICWHCHGTGKVRGNAYDETGCECPKCLGTGRGNESNKC